MDNYTSNASWIPDYTNMQITPEGNISEPTGFAEDPEEAAGLKPLAIVKRTFAILAVSQGAVSGLSGNLFWYEKGYNVMRALTLITTFYYDMTPEQEHWITPMFAWDRYAEL